MRTGRGGLLNFMNKSKTKKSRVVTNAATAAKVERPLIINLADYGGTLTFTQLSAALAGRQNDPAVRAVFQVLRHQLGASRSHELVPGASGGERDYGAGAAGVTETSILWLHLLVQHRPEADALGELRTEFPDPKPESKLQN